ncbi:hypothetical protein [Pararobbsia alpina]|nr:hypothetical protein [Pararobbsia alpina]
MRQMRGRADTTGTAEARYQLAVSQARDRRSDCVASLARIRKQRDYSIDRTLPNEAPMGNAIHTTTQRGERRSIERMKKEPIFDSNVVENLACSALRYRRDT